MLVSKKRTILQPQSAEAMKPQKFHFKYGNPINSDCNEQHISKSESYETLIHFKNVTQPMNLDF